MTFLIAALVIQWHPLIFSFWTGVFQGSFHTIKLNVATLIFSDFAAGMFSYEFKRL